MPVIDLDSGEMGDTQKAQPLPQTTGGIIDLDTGKYVNQQAPEFLRDMPETRVANDDIFYGLPPEIVSKIKTDYPDIRGPENPNKSKFEKLNLGGDPTGIMAAEEVRMGARESQQLRAANLERLRLTNPDLAQEIEGMSAEELDRIAVGRFMSEIVNGVKRLTGNVDEQQLEELKKNTEIFDQLASIKNRVVFTEGLAKAPLYIGGGVGTGAIKATLPRVVTGTMIGAAETGVPSLGSGDTKTEAATQAVIGAGLNVAANELPRLVANHLKNRQLLKADLEANPRDPNLAKYQIVEGRPEVTKKLQEAARQFGGKKGDAVVAAVKNATPEDKAAFKKMVTIIKENKLDPFVKTQTQQPGQVVGESFKKRVLKIKGTNKAAGKEIDKIARQVLRNERADISGAVETFRNKLSELRVNYDPATGAVDFKGSALTGNNAAGTRNLIEDIANRLKTTDISAADAHFLKRFIDEQVVYGKNVGGLGGRADSAIKELRKGINDSIQVEAYKTANATYKESLDWLDDLQSAAGRSIDLESEKALGQSLRRLTSNVKSRALLETVISEGDELAKKYGANFQDDLLLQNGIARALEERFPPIVDTSLRGEVGKGLADKMDFVTSPGRTTLRKTAEVFDKARGITDDKALDALLEILDGK